MGIRYYRPRDLVGTAKTRRLGEKGRLNMSPATLWREVRAGRFVQPVKLSPGVTAFPADEVDAWEAARLAERAKAAA